MSFPAALSGRSIDPAVLPQRDQQQEMDDASHVHSNAGSAAPGSGEQVTNDVETGPPGFPLIDGFHGIAATTASMTPPPQVISSPVVVSTPGFSSSASHSSADGGSDVDMDMDEDDDSGLFANALLSEEQLVLDPALLHEMDELLARDHETPWDPMYLESPSLTFPAPGTSWTMLAHPPAAAPPVSDTPQSEPFVPSGDGWHVHAPKKSPAEMEGDVDMDKSEQCDLEMKEMKLLARQLKFLEAQREFLEYKASLASEESLSTFQLLQNRRDAVQEKKRLVEAQLHQEMLTKVATQQLENLKFIELMLLQTPVSHYRNTLMTPMESYIHLTRDRRERRATLLALRDEKVDATRRYIDFQSRSIDCERQFFYLDTFEKFGKFYTVDFSISRIDDKSVDDVVSVIYNHFVSTKDTIAQILGSVENREYFDGIDWTFMNARFVDRITLPKRRHGDRGFVVQESNTVYYMKKFGETVVLMCDSIDKDDLHPYRRTGRIRKDMSVGIVVEPFVDAKGKQSVLLKRFSFVRHHFKNVEPTAELIQAISTKVILWGQAVRFCLANRDKTPPKTQPVQELLMQVPKISAPVGQVVHENLH